MIEFKKRVILFGVLFEAGKYDEEKVCERIAEKNKWEKIPKFTTIQKVFESKGAVITIDEVVPIKKTEAKEETRTRRKKDEK